MDKRFGCWQLRMAWAWYLNHTAARKPRVEDRGLGQGPNVTMQLLANGNVSPGTDLYFDNLFTSFPLLTDLSNLSIAGTGTMRMSEQAAQCTRFRCLTRKNPQMKWKGVILYLCIKMTRYHWCGGTQSLAAWVGSNKYSQEQMNQILK